MNYIISSFPCIIDCGEKLELKMNVKYLFKDIENKVALVFGYNDEIPYVINFYELSSESKNHSHVLLIENGGDRYFILFPKYYLSPYFTMIKFLGMNISLTLSDKLYIYADDGLVCAENVDKIVYSHHAIKKDFLIIYFTGERNYVVIINKYKELLCAYYYDEFNENENETYFMGRIYDSLNHGQVNKIDNNKNSHEHYLVYLDNYELKLKSDFVCHIFLDCVKAGNFKYANSLLHKDIKLKSEEDINKFFPFFDDFIALSESSNSFALIKKNTLAGIYKFEITDLEISNIITQ